jgi:hypothetical protein
MPLWEQAKNICIAVGGKAHLVGVPGSEHCITSDEALTLDKFPKRVSEGLPQSDTVELFNIKIVPNENNTHDARFP